MVCLGLLKKRVPGNLYRGKNRIVAPVKKRHMNEVQEEFDRQDQIMYLLRYPYLTKVSGLDIVIFSTLVKSYSEILTRILVNVNEVFVIVFHTAERLIIQEI